MPKVKDISGSTFGRLVAIGHVGFNAHKKALWECRCECGVEITAISGNLTSGTTQSCGCLNREINSKRASERNKTHGHAANGKLTPEYSSWASMHRRCRYAGVNSYKDYGGRGITVCERWLSFELFLADMGLKPTPSHSIDRIDSNGNYEPGNCRWATALEQRHNRRA